jgi:hypothetical protein
MIEVGATPVIHGLIAQITTALPFGEIDLPGQCAHTSVSLSPTMYRCRN